LPHARPKTRKHPNRKLTLENGQSRLFVLRPMSHNRAAAGRAVEPRPLKGKFHIPLTNARRRQPVADISAIAVERVSNVNLCRANVVNPQQASAGNDTFAASQRHPVSVLTGNVGTVAPVDTTLSSRTIKSAIGKTSRETETLTWMGRGSIPRWMRDEMREFRLKPEAFLVVGRR
jgi:DNA-binding protein H-NS